MKLIPDWKSAWKFWSVKIMAFNATLLTFVTAFPDAALQAWMLLPADMKTFLPPDYLQVISILLLVVSIFARVVKQNSVTPPPPSDTNK